MTSPHAAEEEDLDEGEDGNPDAARYSMSRAILRESGIPPASSRLGRPTTLAAEGDELAQLALAESTRTEANLTALLRGLSHLIAGANAALEANTALTGELDALRSLLAKSNEEEMALRREVRELGRALDRGRREAMLERAQLLDQEDAFLAEILSDHQREVRELRQKLERATIAPPPIENFDDRPTAPPPAAPPPEPIPIGALKLRTIRIPMPDPPPAGDTEPHTEARPAPPRPASRPPLALKPEAGRPLAGYSLGRDEVREERFDVAASTPLPSTPRE